MVLDKTDLGFGAFCMRNISSFGGVTLLLLLRRFEMLESTCKVYLVEDCSSALVYNEDSGAYYQACTLRSNPRYLLVETLILP